jgi:Asp-tRNA(Asn)/Glu-tRNA(Gln) amidotransferase A subunit family amidase
MALCWSLDKIGPMCRTVEDTALVASAINGFDLDDPGSIAAPFGYDAAAPVKGLRLGYFPKDLALPEADDLDRAALEAARRLGLELVPLERPDLPYDALMNILFAEAAAAFKSSRSTTGMTSLPGRSRAHGPTPSARRASSPPSTTSSSIAFAVA